MSPLTRRNLTIGGIAAVAAAAGAIYEAPRLFKPRAKGHYADLVNLLDEPDKAAAVGRAIHGDAEAAQADLKTRLPGRTLSALAESDAAQGRLVEAQGWVLPEALAQVCVLAAA